MFLRVIGVYTFLFIISLINYILFKIINFGNFIGLYKIEKAEELCRKIFFYILYYSMKSLFWIKIDYKSNTPDNKISGQNIIVCNHVSYFDPLVIGCIMYCYIKEFWKIKFVAYHKVFEIPIAGYIIKSIGTIPIEMKETPMESDNIYIPESSKKMIETCENILYNGYSLFIFPEGRRNNDPSRLNKIKLGAFNLSKKTGCNIQILSLHGIHKIWPAKGNPNGKGTVTVTKCDNPKIFNTPEEYRKDIIRLIDAERSYI